MTSDAVPRIVLVVYAHPDDESFGPAAALARYAREGWKVYGLFFTAGQHGDTGLQPPPSPEELGRMRLADLRDAAAAIGFADLDVLGYVDGTLDQVPTRQLADDALKAIERYRPAVVITFGPGGITRHPDHLAVHRAATAAFDEARARGLGVRELYYDAVPEERAAEMGLSGLPDGSPNTRIDVAATADAQLAALRAHARHVLDAREMVARLEQQPRRYVTFYRAWPEVAPAQQVTNFLG